MFTENEKNIEKSRYPWDIIDMKTKLQYPKKEATHPMSSYQKLKRSGNPQAAVQTVISLLKSHSPKEVAKITGISVRWVYMLRKRYLESNQNLDLCILKRGTKSPMPNRTNYTDLKCF
ncbi:helix-turn-helix domain-containing protein [Peptococcaceae bacterium]|nr:helix-turn-helix domain-containing protein [Peptococcaceae bacterium]MCL0052102.1 helix-turn-helix domain-containing protein [Peptococcaceae bacterium]MCL0063436.1 helix-turn-helix domain-containing protein [Peptococcaceae bacterium]